MHRSNDIKPDYTDFVIKEEFEIKQEQEDDDTIYQIIEFEHIFKPEEPIKEEIQGYEEDSIASLQNDIKVQRIYSEHNYARTIQPLGHKSKYPKIKRKKKAEKRPFEPQFCNICGKRFARLHAFEKHLLNHRHGTTRSLFECDTCGAKFKRWIYIKRHILTLHAANPTTLKVPCKICGKYYDRRYLIAHENIHNTQNQKPSHQCLTCGKYFHARLNLLAHSRRHREKKTAPCPICGKLFGVPDPLRVHLRIHTGEKPYLCSICGSRYHSRSTFETHQSVHWTGKNFPCNMCDAKFKNPNILGGHKRRVHGPKIPKPKVIKQMPAPLPPSLPKPLQENPANDIKPMFANIRTYSKYSSK